MCKNEYNYWMWFELVGVLNELNLSLGEYKKLETSVVMLIYL
jgi:hypothetical protein